MKKVIVLILALLMLCLSACGNVTPTTEPTDTVPTGTEPTDTEPTVCEHSVQSEVTVTKAGIFTDGQKQIVCDNCGKLISDMTIPATKSIKILAIGNSFSVDATTFLYDLLKAAGVEEIVIGHAYIGGCTIKKHFMMSKSPSTAYKYTKYTSSGKKEQESSLLGMVTDESWDIVTLQQASQDSGMPATYENLPGLIDFVLENCTNKQVDIKFHMTWAYQQDSTHSGFNNYNNDQMTMYNAIKSTVQDVVLKQEAISGVLPSGTAIQNLRTSYLGDTLTCDGYHLSTDIGRYTAGLTWTCAITGKSPDEIEWTPASFKIVKENISPIREAVKNAIAVPFEVTESLMK